MKPFDQLTEHGELRRLRTLTLKALEHYNLQVKQVRFFTVETNTMFRIDTHDGARYVLRIYSDEETTLAENRVEMYWLKALIRDTDLHVTQPVPRKDGDYITIVEVPGVPGERRCALFEWVPGRTLYNYLSHKNYYLLGQSMAKLHQHAASLNPPPDLKPKRWDRVFYYPDEPVVYNTAPYRHLFPPERIALIDKIIQQAGQLFKALYANEGDLIWIHGDLHYWNVHVYRGELYIIDFEDVMDCHPVQDIAVTLYYGRDRDDYDDLRQSFELGYRSLRQWPVRVERQLETLMAARSVNFINYVARIDPDPEEYINRKCQELNNYLDQNSVQYTY